MERLENTGKVLVDALVDDVARQCAIRDHPSSAVQKSPWKSTKPFHSDIEKPRKTRTKAPSNAPELHSTAFHGRKSRNHMIPGRRSLLPAASTFLPPNLVEAILPPRSDCIQTAAFRIWLCLKAQALWDRMIWLRCPVDEVLAGFKASTNKMTLLRTAGS